ncbi:hypothetical protein PV336_42595 [Streptomyces sp. MI02-2A]|uniref:hypothetical protein n=1 Tax=unclassified Streptomyces TaxID=2593676 RepID=UPI00131EAAD9|nr:MULTISPECIES: hypothetical protein [unclassified Streptomyces]MDX3265786.1 hypothetical protein [Streptomyces sp. MI02-2A]
MNENICDAIAIQVADLGSLGREWSSRAADWYAGPMHCARKPILLGTRTLRASQVTGRQNFQKANWQRLRVAAEASINSRTDDSCSEWVISLFPPMDKLWHSR